MNFFATCPKGFERLLAAELASLGITQVRPLKGQVSFEGGLDGAYRACLWSRLASRVMLTLARIDATDADALYAGMGSIDWTRHLAPGATFAIDAHGTNAELRNTQFTALRSKDAISDQLLARRGARPAQDPADPDLTIAVRVSRDHATVAIDLSGAPLFRRRFLLRGGGSHGIVFQKSASCKHQHQRRRNSSRRTKPRPDAPPVPFPMDRLLPRRFRRLGELLRRRIQKSRRPLHGFKVFSALFARFQMGADLAFLLRGKFAVPICAQRFESALFVLMPQHGRSPPL